MRSVVRDMDALNVQKMFREGTHEDDILKELMSQSYDKFQIELSDMQVSLNIYIFFYIRKLLKRKMC